MSLLPFSLFCRSLLAFAVKSTLPHVQLIGGMGGDTAFYYDFLLPAKLSVNDEMLEMVHERIRVLRRSGWSLRRASMLPAVAKGLLASHGETFLSRIIAQTSRDLVEILQDNGSFADWVQEPVCQEEPLDGVFQVVAVKCLARSGLFFHRFFALLAPDKQQLRERVKRYHRQPYRSHDAFLELNPSFMVEGGDRLWSWGESAVMIDLLKDRLRESLAALKVFQVMLPSFSLETQKGIFLERNDWLKALLSQFPEEKEGFSQTLFVRESSVGFLQEGLFAPLGGWIDKTILFTHDQKDAEKKCGQILEMVSAFYLLLGLDVKVRAWGGSKAPFSVKLFLNSLGVEHRFSDQDHRAMVTWVVEDAVSIDRECGHLVWRKIGRRFAFEFSVVGFFESILPLLLEQNQSFPFWLAPIQVALVCLEESCREKMALLEDRLQKSGVRATLIGDCGGSHRGDLMRGLRNRKIPVVIFMGEEERQAAMVRYKFFDLGEEKTVPIDDLLLSLIQLNLFPKHGLLGEQRMGVS